MDRYETGSMSWRERVFWIVVLILMSWLVFGCAQKPPNDDICFKHSIAEANCTWMVQGTDFVVNDTGSFYTRNKHHWNYEELRDHSFWVPPETYGDMRNFFLNYCHAHPNTCNYNVMVQKFTEFEQRVNQKVTPWDDSMLIEDLNEID